MSLSGNVPIQQSPLIKVPIQVSGYFSYILVGDNVDKTIRPHHMTIDHQKQSLHYFQIYAAKDRIDLRNFHNDRPIRNDPSLPLSTFLPNVEDCSVLQANYAILMGREVIKRLSYFKIFADCIPMHILHKHSDEMSRKSELVSMHVNNV